MNDNDDFDQGYEDTRNYRALACLEGFAVADRRAIAEELAGLLRSQQEISREVRDKLADAIIRGCEKPHKDDVDRRPRLTVNDTGLRGQLCAAVLTRRRWWDAAEEELQAKREGRKGTAISLEIANRHGIDIEMMKKARRFHKDFLAEYENIDSILRVAMRADGSEGDLDYGLLEDHYWNARGKYIERVSSELVGTSFALEDGSGDNSRA